MKQLFSLFIFTIIFQATNAQSKQPDISKPDPSKKILTVEVSCGECKFHLKGENCDLAVRIKGKAHFIDGANIDSFGDAHGKMGFCNAIRKAEVQGEVVNDRFKVTYIKLLSSKK
ncbi:MAG: hypothetical protein IPJ81_16775 [Chitinophagaceae bacterium]|nr:hypothetical protein [Chitinophagaceae bacterium]